MLEVKNPITGVVYPASEKVESYFERGLLTKETLVQAISDSLLQNADRVALYDGGNITTYGDLDELSARLAVGMLKLGLKPRDSVLLQLPNGRDLVIYFIACLKSDDQRLHV